MDDTNRYVRTAFDPLQSTTSGSLREVRFAIDQDAPLLGRGWSPENSATSIQSHAKGIIASSIHGGVPPIELISTSKNVRGEL